MRSKFHKKLSFHILSLVMILSILFVQIPVFAAGNTLPTEITIFHTNDMHGRLLDAFNTAKAPVLTQIGSDYVAAIKKSVPNSLLIDAGDASQGVPFATISKGADIIKLMNAAGYDGMALGNHEFDYGKAQTLTNVALANFPIVSANTIQNGQPLLAGINGSNGSDFLKTVNGIKVGFFGITTQETVYKTNPTNLQGVTFEDPIATSKTEVSKLRSEGATVIVGIMHIGNDPSSSPISDDIAKDVNGINVIIDGHSHTIENKHVKNTLIAQTGCYSANLGRIDIAVDATGEVKANENMISAANASTYTPDPTVKALATQINTSQAPIFAKVVGRINNSLWGGTVNGESVGRLGETNLGDLVADAMADSGKSQIKGTSYDGLPVISLENGGGVRDSIPEGNINQGQITTVLPFGNILSLKEVTPATLYKVIENGVSKIVGQDSTTGIITGADGRFPQISGMRFEYNPLKASLNRVTKIVLTNSDGTDKQVLDPSDTTTKIVLASNDYEVGGGDGYTMLGSLKNIGEGNALDVITSQYITKLTQQGGGSFTYPSTKGRGKAISRYVYKPYTATIAVKNGTTAVANTKVIYSIDNSSIAVATTDSNGILTIANIKSGAHTVSIITNDLDADVYINDLIGSNTSANVIASLQSADASVAQKVNDIIDELPSKITLSDKDSVATARFAYNNLTSTQMALVGSNSKLTAAEATITQLESTPVNTVTPITPSPVNLTTNPSLNIIKNSALGNSTIKTLPQTGSPIDTNVLVLLGSLCFIAGTITLISQKIKKNKKYAA